MKILVDLDGTLLDSRARLHGLFCALVPDSGLDRDSYWTLKRQPRSHRQLLTERGMAGAAIDLFERDWLEAIETEPYLALDEAFPYAGEALASLSERAGLLLVTARQSEAGAINQLERLNIAPFFEQVIVTGQGRTKAAAVRASGVRLAEGDMVVGDTRADIELARELGLVAVAVASGFRCRAYLEQAGADFLYADLLEFSSVHFGECPARS